MRHALWTRIKNKPEIMLLVRSGVKISKEATIIIILAFYFSDPVPLFLVQDHFSCKYVQPTCKFKLLFDNEALISKSATCCVKAIHTVRAALRHPGE